MMREKQNRYRPEKLLRLESEIRDCMKFGFFTVDFNTFNFDIRIPNQDSGTMDSPSKTRIQDSYQDSGTIF